MSGEELDELQGSNLYEVLERARPLWMITAGSRAHSVRVGTETAVVANGQYIGGLGSLRSLPSKGVHSIRRLRGTEAANGIAGFLSVQHLDAAILVSFGCSAV